MDPGIAKLLQKSRARRQELRDFSSDKSPLPSEKVRERSPLKQLNKSPIRKVEIVEDSPSNTVKRMLSRESLENNVKDLLSRDSPTKKIVSKTTVSPGKTTYTKTVITEKEEKFERNEVITYSGNKMELDDLRKKFDINGDTQKKGYDCGTFTKRDTSPSRQITITRVSPSKTVTKSPTRPVLSPEKPSPVKYYSSPEKPFIKKYSPVKTNPCNDHDENKTVSTDWETGKKARLAALSNKFRNFDEAEERNSTVREVQLPKPVTKPPPPVPSPSKHAPVNTDHLRSRSPVKASPHNNPNQFISPQVTGRSPTKPGDIASTRSVRFVSPTKAPAPQPPVRDRSVSPCAEAKESTTDSSLMESLKAQGFQETSSQSKLVYKFDKKEQENVDGTRKSPIRSNTFVKNDEAAKERDRSVSPVRANPFLVKDQQNPERRERGRSPTKKTAAPQPRSYSPEKPHPLQFVTSGVAQGPPKPSRTFGTVNPAVNTIQQEEGTRVDSPVMMSVSKKREMFETGAHVTPEADRPDPALIPLSQRKALFEKNKSVPTPIARFGESVTPAMLAKVKPSEPSSMTPSEAWKRKRPVSPGKGVILSAAKHESSRAANAPAVTPKVTQPSDTEPMMREDLGSTPLAGRKTTEMQKKLFEANNADWRDNSIAKRAAEEKQNEMNLLLNRYNHLRKQSDDQEPETKKEEVYYPGVNSMKRVKVSPPRPGQLYPSINLDSDSDRPESVMSTDSQESCMTSATGISEAPSLGADIVTASRIGTGLAPEPELATIQENNDSMDTDDGDVLTDSVIGAEIDDIIGDEDIDEDDDFPTPPKVSKVSSSSSGSDQMGRSESTTSWEFHTPQAPRIVNPAGHSRYQTPLITTNSPSTPDQQKVTIEGEEGPLMHTVSFYRRNKNPQSTPVQRIVLNPSLETHSEVVESPRATITQKIHKLQEEANNQLPVIQQASSAVNLCRSTNEFFGSIEQVEGEKLLLVATHKRAAAVNEVQRLKTEGGLGADPARDNSVRGTVSLCGIRLGLKKEFVEQVRSGEAGDFVHYFLCLVRCAGQCISTEMVNTSEGLDGCELNFPNLINFRDLDKSFSIQLEVYGLQTKKEQLTHDTKYHIKKGKMPFAALTPKLKMSKTESKLARPNVSSPGGPHTVRTSSFAMVRGIVLETMVNKLNFRLETQ